VQVWAYFAKCIKGFACVTWGSPAKQKYAKALNYFEQEAHGFVIM
jgi:hypothetical protein